METAIKILGSRIINHKSDISHSLWDVKLLLHLIGKKYYFLLCAVFLQVLSMSKSFSSSYLYSAFDALPSIFISSSPNRYSHFETLEPRIIFLINTFVLTKNFFFQMKFEIFQGKIHFPILQSIIIL